MNTRNVATVFFGLVVVLTLVVPTIGAAHLHSIDHVWNDTGVNTSLALTHEEGAQWNAPRSDQFRTDLNEWLLKNSQAFWNDGGLNTRSIQNETTGWNDFGVSVVRIGNHTTGWNDTGTGVALS
jgi:hypothetical protein